MTMNSDEARKTIESLHAVGSPVERGVGRLEPERDDDDEPDEPVCPHCSGDGMDPMTDYLLPCWLCQGEQRP